MGTEADRYTIEVTRTAEGWDAHLWPVHPDGGSVLTIYEGTDVTPSGAVEDLLDDLGAGAWPSATEQQDRHHP